MSIRIKKEKKNNCKFRSNNQIHGGRKAPNNKIQKVNNINNVQYWTRRCLQWMMCCWWPARSPTSLKVTFAISTRPRCAATHTASDTDVQWQWRNGLDSIAANDTGPRLDKSQNSPQGMPLFHCIHRFYSAFSLVPFLGRMENDSFSFGICSSGYYAAFDSNGVAVRKKARLITNYHSPSTDACVKFYYYKRSVRQLPRELIPGDGIINLTDDGRVNWASQTKE